MKMNRVSYQIFESYSAHTILIIVSAMGVKQSFYKNFAEYAQENGVSVITFDYSGIGTSLNGKIKGQKDNLSDWGKKDLEFILELVKEKFPRHRKVILGHSVGGQLIGFASSSKDLDKIILVSAQSGYWRFWHGFNKAKMFLNWHVLFPLLINFFGFMPSKSFSKMENLPKNVAKEWAKWCKNPNYLFNYFSDEEIFFDKIECNLLSLSIDDDFFAPRTSVDWLTEKYGKTKINRKHLVPQHFQISKIGHFGLFRIKLKDLFWTYLLNEIKN